MANEVTLTITGNLTNDLELRYTQGGAAVASFTVAATPKTFDRNTNEWKDGETLFQRCSIWKEAAENATESLTKGMRVIVTGRLKSRSYDTKEGEKRTVIELEVDEIGPSLRYATAKVTRTQRNANAPAAQPSGFGPSTAQTDPWATPATANAGGWGNGPATSEPPF